LFVCLFVCAKNENEEKKYYISLYFLDTCFTP